jgi:hypothetical protein
MASILSEQDSSKDTQAQPELEAKIGGCLISSYIKCPPASPASGAKSVACNQIVVELVCLATQVLPRGGFPRKLALDICKNLFLI